MIKGASMVRKVLLGVVVAASACAVAAHADADAPRWFTDIGEAKVAAKWGIPETDAVGFDMRCLEDGTIIMRPALYAIDKPDIVPDIALTVDDEPYVRPLRLVFSELDGAWQAEIPVARDDAVIAALRRGNTLTYDFAPPLRDGDAFTLSLTGSARAIDAALSAC